MKSLKHKLMICLTKGLFKRVKVLMFFYFQAFNNFLIHEEVRFNMGQRAEQYETQANEGYQRLVFDLRGWIRLHMIKERFLIKRFSKLRTRIDGPSKIIKKIEENAYKLELPNDYNILPTFNVKDLRPYHVGDLRASISPDYGGIDARASTTTIGNLILIMGNLDSRGYETLEA